MSAADQRADTRASSADSSPASPQRVLMVSVRADHGGGPRHMETLLRHAPPALQAYVACPREAPYWERFAELVGEHRLFEIPHRRWSLSAAAALAGFARQAGIDIVHSHGKGAGLYARFVAARTGLPCVHTPHGVHVANYDRLRRRLYVAYENLTARWVDRVLYVSESERAAARSAGLWGRVPGEIIPNGVEPVADDQIECWRRGKRTELGLAEGQFVVATVSRFDAQKNMAAALEIAASLPDMIFLWIGDGPERAGLEQAARVRGIGNIRYLGFVDDPRAYLAAADAYLSTSFGEAGVPFAAIEAMCVGLLCVLSDVTGHRQHFPGEMGIYRFPLTDLNQCSTVLTSAKRQGVIEKTKISASIRHYQNATFSAETMALSIFEIYKKLPIATD